MRKLFPLVLTICFLAGILAACGAPAQESGSAQPTASPAQDGASPATEPEAQQTPAAGSSGGTISYTDGEELTNFTSYIADQYKKFEAPLYDGFAAREEADPSFAFTSLDIQSHLINATLSVMYAPYHLQGWKVAEVPVQISKDGGRIVWKLEGPGKSVDPSVGEFEMSQNGWLDTGANTLFCESTQTKDGKIIMRQVIENAVTDDGTVMTSCYSYDWSARSESAVTSADIFRFNGNEGMFEAHLGTLAEAGEDFTYPSILGGDLPVGEYSAIAKAIATVTVSGGKADIQLP